MQFKNTLGCRHLLLATLAFGCLALANPSTASNAVPQNKRHHDEIGPMGPTGPAGVPGATGATGAVGVDGATGDQGLPGVPGATGATGTSGNTGSTGIVGATGATGATGVGGATGVQGLSGVPGATGSTGPSGNAGSAGNMGATGATGATGTAGGLVAFADFFALMPPDNAATVAVGGDVQFPQDGESSGNGSIVRAGLSTFILSDVGVYQVSFQVSVTEAGQLALALNQGAGFLEIQSTVVGRATGTSQIVETALVRTVVPNSVLAVRNPASESTALTITPLAGGTNPVSAHLVITQLQGAFGVTGATGPTGATGATGPAGSPGFSSF
jgi:hypothetical protein